MKTTPIYFAICCLAYIVGLFLTYGFIVMPGLEIIDDRSFVAAFQGLESRFAFQSSGYANIPAMIAFPGSIVAIVLSGLLNRESRLLKWIAMALFFFALGAVSTVLVNLPSNAAIFNAGDPQKIDVTAVRQAFNEGAWTNWNHFRTLTTILSMLCMIQVLRLRNT